MSDNTGKINFKTEKFSLDSSVIIAFFNSNLNFILKEVFKNKIFFSSEIFKEIKSYNLDSLNYQILKAKTIEEIFGSKLEWNRLDNKRASRIRKIYDYANLNDVEEWDKLQEDMINDMIRLEKALKEFIDKI